MERTRLNGSYRLEPRSTLLRNVDFGPPAQVPQIRLDSHY